ncbi:uncharacterized protein [Spinacia oleracea]|uniref:Major facilitator superfamily (MFS) profile domain-containing protein n=1 Tax=Spinacia oleracea TaxID=3562 RepID=A0ABM3QRK1_SPIOL|nr:uncharacterized protein LOC110785171 [Spinacia oleracea]
MLAPDEELARLYLNARGDVVCLPWRNFLDRRGHYDDFLRRLAPPVRFVVPEEEVDPEDLLYADRVVRYENSDREQVEVTVAVASPPHQRSYDAVPEHYAAERRRGCRGSVYREPQMETSLGQEGPSLDLPVVVLIRDILMLIWELPLLNSFVGCRITASLFFQIDSPNSIKKFLKGSLALDIGRLAGGYGMGAFSYVVPVYIAEISPVNLRGALTTLNQVMICTGVSVAFIIGIVLSWRTLALTGLVPCAVLLLGLCFIPESPRWMAKIGSQKEFEAAFQKLRGKDADITHEAAEIQDYIEELEKMPKANMFDLFQKRYLRSVTVTLEIPWVKWEDGWTWEVKAQLMEAVEWPQKHQDAFERIGTCPPTGVLLFGPPWMQQNAHGPSCSF